MQQQPQQHCHSSRSISVAPFLAHLSKCVAGCCLMVDTPMGVSLMRTPLTVLCDELDVVGKGDTPMGVSRTSAPLIDFVGLPREGREFDPKQRMTIR